MRTLRLVEIAQLLGVTKQRAHQIAEERGFPRPLAEGRPWTSLEPIRGAGVGEAMATREALALGQPVAFGAGDDVNPEPLRA
jgi:hypothetical protein